MSTRVEGAGPIAPAADGPDVTYGVGEVGEVLELSSCTSSDSGKKEARLPKTLKDPALRANRRLFWEK